MRLLEVLFVCGAGTIRRLKESHLCQISPFSILDLNCTRAHLGQVTKGFCEIRICWRVAPRHFPSLWIPSSEESIALAEPLDGLWDSETEG